MKTPTKMQLIGAAYACNPLVVSGSYVVSFFRVLFYLLFSYPDRLHD